jgi:hypothetical protein
MMGNRPSDSHAPVSQYPSAHDDDEIIEDSREKICNGREYDGWEHYTSKDANLPSYSITQDSSISEYETKEEVQKMDAILLGWTLSNVVLFISGLNIILTMFITTGAAFAAIRSVSPHRASDTRRGENQQ